MGTIGIVFTAMLFSCSTAPTPLLNFAEYYSHVRKDTIYPSAKQIEMLKVIMQNNTYQPAPPINDRSYWGNIAASL